MVLDLAQMVLAVRKHLQMTNMIILDNFGFKKCLKKSISGDVLDLGLHLAVLGAGLGPDGPGCPEKPLKD